MLTLMKTVLKAFFLLLSFKVNQNMKTFIIAQEAHSLSDRRLEKGKKFKIFNRGLNYLYKEEVS